MISIDKKDVIKTVVIIWFVAATGYVIYDQYIGYKVRGMQAAYQQGIADTTKQIFDKSQADQCKQPMELTLGDSKLQLIDVNCLKQQQPQAGAQGQPAPASINAPQTPVKK